MRLPLRSARSFALSFLMLAVAACSALDEEAGVAIDMKLPDGGLPVFLETPWPSDLLRRSVDGKDTLDLRAFPNPFGSTTLDDDIVFFQTAEGFSGVGPLYFHVAGGVDATSLPASPAASLGPDASLFLVEVDAPERPIPLEWRDHPAGTSFLPAGTIAAAPALGAVVQRRAALVVTRRARAPNGAPLVASEDMRALLRGDTPAGEPYARLARDLERTRALALDDIALMQMFTPVDATRALAAAAARVRASPPPAMRDLVLAETHPTYELFRGTVELPQFQAGVPPYRTFDGVEGGFVLDDDGVPVVQRTEAVPFVLTVPKGDVPLAGFPVCVLGHGTGGSLDSGIGDTPADEAFQLASAGYAMLTVSEPLHRTREGFSESEVNLLTFNFLNPLAGRDNQRQSALEKVALVSAALALEVPNVRFDDGRVAYFGHSQGGIVGTLLVGIDDRLSGAFLSGAGGGFAASIVDKKEPVAMTDVLRFALRMPDSEPIDRFHPILALVQTWVEPAEPLRYGTLWRDRRGAPVPHLVLTSGLLDTFTPKSTHSALAAAFGLPLVRPIAETNPLLALLGILDVDAPIAGNAHDADGAPITAGMLQFPNDGHFAVFRNAAGQEAMRSFFSTLRSGVPRVQGL